MGIRAPDIKDVKKGIDLVCGGLRFLHFYMHETMQFKAI